MSASSFLRRLFGGGPGSADGAVQHRWRLSDALIAESSEYTSTASRATIRRRPMR
jgi:hypothetical protein